MVAMNRPPYFAFFAAGAEWDTIERAEEMHDEVDEAGVRMDSGERSRIDRLIRLDMVDQMLFLFCFGMKSNVRLNVKAPKQQSYTHTADANLAQKPIHMYSPEAAA
jgi:hypothetical protein